MADNMAPSPSFATANMKPATAGNETIDALWGRSIADNTGFLYGRPLCVPYDDLTSKQNFDTDNGGIVAATIVMNRPLYRPHGHNQWRGTFSATTFHQGATSIWSESGGGGVSGTVINTYVGSPTYDNYGTISWGLYGNLGTYLETTNFAQVNTFNYIRSQSWATTLNLANYVSEGSYAKFRMTVIGTRDDPVHSGTLVTTLRDFQVDTRWA